MAAKKNCVHLHLDVERVYSEGDNFFGKKDDEGINVFAHTMREFFVHENIFLSLLYHLNILDYII